MSTSYLKRLAMDELSQAHLFLKLGPSVQLINTVI